MTDLDDWVAALADRHVSAFSRSEFLKAVRALSVRYVERRSSLRTKSPLDSAGKRAAFAAFYTPLHLLTVRAIVAELRPAGVARVVDLGCGTGAASAGWCLADAQRPIISGVDRNGWALDEARWNWRTLQLRGDARRGDLIEEAGRLAKRGTLDTAVVCGWSVNELDDADRGRLLPVLLDLARAGSAVLIVEPLARSATPWWPEWSAAWRAAGGRADEWKLPANLPPRLASLDRDAGFHREHLNARSLYLGRCI